MTKDPPDLLVMVGTRNHWIRWWFAWSLDPFGGQVDYGEILGFAHSLNGNNRYTRIRTPITGPGD